MGNVIHMDTEQVRAVARQLQQNANQMYEMGSSLRHQTASMDWQGPSRDDFFSQLEQALKQLNTLSESGLVLGERVNREVEEWVTADQNGASSFQSMVANWKEKIELLPKGWDQPGGGLGFTLLGGGVVLGTQAGMSEAAAYQNERVNDTLLIDPKDTPDYQKALKNTPRLPFESEAHHEWRVQRELEHIRWKRDYYKEKGWGPDFGPSGDINRFEKWLNERSEWNKHKREWEQDHPPESGYFG